MLLLVVVGPERLPGMAYQIGRAVRTMQQYARAVRDEFGGEIAYIEEQYKTVRGEVDQARRELRDQQVQLEGEMRDAAASLQVPELTQSGGTALNPVKVVEPSTLTMENAAALSEYGMPDDPKPAAAAPNGEGKPPPPLVF